MRLGFFGLHPRIYLWPHQTVNLPYWPHRVLVISRGRVTRRHTFNNWLPSAYRMHMDFCCRARISEWADISKNE